MARDHRRSPARLSRHGPLRPERGREELGSARGRDRRAARPGDAQLRGLRPARAPARDRLRLERRSARLAERGAPVRRCRNCTPARGRPASGLARRRPDGVVRARRRARARDPRPVRRVLHVLRAESRGIRVCRRAREGGREPRRAGPLPLLDPGGRPRQARPVRRPGPRSLAEPAAHRASRSRGRKGGDRAPGGAVERTRGGRRPEDRARAGPRRGGAVRGGAGERARRQSGQRPSRVDAGPQDGHGSRRGPLSPAGHVAALGGGAPERQPSDPCRDAPAGWAAETASSAATSIR